jgi:guanine nucleotide-binding protein subunit alpha
MSLAFVRIIAISDVRSIQDFDGEPREATPGREYFKKRFARLAQKAGRSKDREIYIQSVPRCVTDHYC